jgi:hypothetical protein
LRFSSGRSCRNSNRLADRRRQSTILGPLQGFQDRRAHTVSYLSATGEARIDTEIDLSVKVAFLSVFAFSHRSEEIWRAGRLMSRRQGAVHAGNVIRPHVVVA